MTPPEPQGTLSNGRPSGRAAHYPGLRARRTPLATAIPKRPSPPIDQARLLPRFRTPNWQTPHRLDDSHEPDWRPGEPTMKPSNQITTWSAEDLRGIPIIGPGSPGTMPGTDPFTQASRNNQAA